MLHIEGNLRIAGPYGEALVQVKDGRLAVRPASLAQGVRLLRALGLRRIPAVARLLDCVGLTLSLQAPLSLAFILGRRVSPGPLLRALGARNLALRTQTPSESISPH